MTAQTYSFAQLRDLWIQAGGPAWAADLAAAIALAESSGRVLARNTGNADGTTDYGLWQINSVHTDLLTRYNLFDPLQNAQAAVELFNGAQHKFTDWVAYNKGTYRQYLPSGSPDATAQTPAGPIPTARPATTANAAGPWWWPELPTYVRQWESDLIVGSIVVAAFTAGVALMAAPAIEASVREAVKIAPEAAAAA